MFYSHNPFGCSVWRSYDAVCENYDTEYHILLKSVGSAAESCGVPYNGWYRSECSIPVLCGICVQVPKARMEAEFVVWKKWFWVDQCGYKCEVLLNQVYNLDFEFGKPYAVSKVPLCPTEYLSISIRLAHRYAEPE